MTLSQNILDSSGWRMHGRISSTQVILFAERKSVIVTDVTHIIRHKTAISVYHNFFYTRMNLSVVFD